MPAKTKAAAAEKRKTTKQKSPAKSLKPPAKTQKNAEKNTITAIDFCGVKLTVKRREFVINYCTPGQSGFHNAMQAALLAGYSKASCSGEIYRILQEPDIQKIIQKNERMAHMALHESAKRAIELKQRRAFYDPIDYFEK